MHKTSLIFLGLLLLFKIDCFAQSINETITITTYYPSPHGVYGVLTMYPRQDEPDNPQEGDMYYNKTEKNIKFHNDTAWVNITMGGGGGVAGGWEHNTTSGHVYNVNTGHIGIGTNNPSRKLTIVGTATDLVKLQLRGPHPDFELVDTQVPSGVQISNDGNLFEILRDDGGDSGFSSTSYLMAIEIPSGNVGIGTSNPQQKLDVNGAMRLAPSTAPAAPVAAGSMYYDNTTDTLRYRDATAPAQWNNFISEYGTVSFLGGEDLKTVNFRKTYVNRPLVIATVVTTQDADDEMVFVRVYKLTKTYVQFDIDSWRGAPAANVGFKSDATDDVEVHYIVIPQ